MNLPVYTLMFGLLIWSIIINVALHPVQSNCKGLKTGMEVVVDDNKATLLQRTGAWGDECNYWVKLDNGVEKVVNYSDIKQEE